MTTFCPKFTCLTVIEIEQCSNTSNSGSKSPLFWYEQHHNTFSLKLQKWSKNGA